MKRIIAIAVLLLSIVANGFAQSEGNGNEQPKEMHFTSPDKPGTPSRPKKPEFCPIYGFLYLDEVTIYSIEEGSAEIEVYSNNSAFIFSATVNELLTGYTFTLPESGNEFTITVRFNGKEYISEIK